MKHILLILAFIAVSCKTVHKATSEIKSTIDSTKVATIDSSHVKNETDISTGTKIDDVKIIINYPKVDSTKPFIPGVPSIKPIKSGKGNSISDIVKGAISASGEAGRLPESIEISIGGIQDSTKIDSKHDSIGVKGNDSTKIKASNESYNKNVSKSGPSVGDYIIMGLIALAVIAVFILKDKLRI